MRAQELTLANRFEFLGTPHLVAIAVIAMVAVALPLLVRKRRDPTLERFIAVGLALLLVGAEVTNWIRGALVSETLQQFAQTYLPLHLCAGALFLCAGALVYRSPLVFELAYYWGTVGTLQAVLTPSMDGGFPDFVFFLFFVAHGGILVAVVYATWGMGMRPRKGAILRVWLLTQVVAVVVGTINLLLDANYLFLCKIPDTASVFFIAPWPWYLPFLDAVGIVLMLLFSLPFWLERRGRVTP